MTNTEKADSLACETSDDSRFQPSDINGAMLRVIRQINKGKTIKEAFSRLGERKDDPKHFAFLVKVQLIGTIRHALTNGSRNFSESNPFIQDPAHVYGELMMIPEMTNNIPVEETPINDFCRAVSYVRENLQNGIDMQNAANARGIRF